MRIVLMIIVCWVITAGKLDAQTTYRARTVDRAFELLLHRVTQIVADFNERKPPRSNEGLVKELIILREVLAEAGEVTVDRHSDNTLLLEANNQAIFGEQPILPKEQRNGGIWSFDPVRLEIQQRGLFVFGLRFKGSRTIRIKAVTLIFHDGSRVRHREWEDRERGNGVAFRKRRFVPMRRAYLVGGKREAKELAAIEILGSAQDGDYESRLDFQFEVPDPDSNPYETVITMLDRLGETWLGRQVTADDLNRCLLDLKDVAAALELPFCIETPAVTPR